MLGGTMAHEEEMSATRKTPAEALVIACLLAIVGLWHPARAQDAASLQFETVSVRQDKSATGGAGIDSPPDGDRITIRHMSPHMLIGLAYDLPLHDEIYGLPGWTDTANYDIDAKVPESELPQFHKLLPRERNPMLRAVLQSRFHLKFHYEEKPLAAFELVQGRKGLQLTEASGAANDSPGQFHTAHGQIAAKGVRMADLVQVLSQQVGRPVVDGTGLKGNYDFTLKWTPDLGTAAPDANGDSGPSIFTAIEEQLGLKLVATKAPVRVLVVDHIDRPDEN